MRKIREVLRLHYELGCTHREIHASTGLSKRSVSDYLKRASAAGLTWESARNLDDAELEARVFKQVGRNEPPARIPIDFEWVHRELRKTGVTLQTLWIDYQEGAQLCNSSQRPYQYSQFCDLCSAWKSPADWYGGPVLDWHSFVDRADSVAMIDRTRLAESWSTALEVIPPIGLLSYLKGLALETQSTVVFYSCSMWGGDVEREYAWIFGDTELALVGLQSETPGGPRPVAILEPSEPTRVVTGDVLVSTLRHLSLALPAPFFAPHTRAFPWGKYNLARRPA